jgi:L-amino acid N-acyltransferase YncA
MQKNCEPGVGSNICECDTDGPPLASSTSGTTYHLGIQASRCARRRDAAQHCYNDAKKHQVDARHTGIGSHLVSSVKHRLHTSSERMYEALLPVVSLTLLREMRMHRSQRQPGSLL